MTIALAIDPESKRLIAAQPLNNLGQEVRSSGAADDDGQPKQQFHDNEQAVVRE